jgi:predicted transposase/invertase (TIGR01784 family)
MQESVVYRSILREGLEKGLQQGLRQGLQQGREEERRILALNFLQEGISLEVIARATGLSVDQIQQLQTTLPPSTQDE